LRIGDEKSTLVQLVGRARPDASQRARNPKHHTPTLTSTAQRLPPPLLLRRLSILSSTLDAKLVVLILVVIVFRFFELFMLGQGR